KNLVSIEEHQRGDYVLIETEVYSYQLNVQQLLRYLLRHFPDVMPAFLPVLKEV
ncbi:hypothetical protein P7K49_035480, partial [Saguinus oedipus]